MEHRQRCALKNALREAKDDHYPVLSRYKYPGGHSLRIVWEESMPQPGQNGIYTHVPFFALWRTASITFILAAASSIGVGTSVLLRMACEKASP